MEKALELTGGNREEAATLLGIGGGSQYLRKQLIQGARSVLLRLGPG